MLEILISNSKDRKWVLKEVEELQECGLETYGDFVGYWKNHFCKNQYPPAKFKEFCINFLATIKNELTY